MPAAPDIILTLPRDVVLRLLQLRRTIRPTPGTMAELLHHSLVDKLYGARDVSAIRPGAPCRLVVTRTEAATLREWCVAVPPTVVGVKALRAAAADIAAALRDA